jgi:hypothetical protein
MIIEKNSIKNDNINSKFAVFIYFHQKLKLTFLEFS